MLIIDPLNITYYSLKILNQIIGWIWGKHGFLKQLGVVDIAGSGAVHLVGGTSGTSWWRQVHSDHIRYNLMTSSHSDDIRCILMPSSTFWWRQVHFDDIRYILMTSGAFWWHLVHSYYIRYILMTSDVLISWWIAVNSFLVFFRLSFSVLHEVGLKPMTIGSCFKLANRSTQYVLIDHLFSFFSNNLRNINCTLRQDSNSDRQIRAKMLTTWLLPPHPGPHSTQNVFVASIVKVTKDGISSYFVFLCFI